MLSAGCLGFLTGNEPLAAEAEPVNVSDNALEETGYQHNGTEKIALNRSVNISGETRQVRLTNWKSAYTPSEGAVGEFNAARFMAYSSPSLENFGIALNPIAQLDAKKTVELILERQNGMQSFEHVDETEVNTLGKNATVDEFEGTITVNGRETKVTIQMVQVKHDGDHIIAFGVYPTNANEEDAILTLIENLEHSSD